MRRFLLLMGFGFATFLFTSPSKAQVSGNFGDPFFQYYSWYLPQQNFLASIPRQEDTLRAMAVQRQMSAATDRAVLSQPPGSLMGYDPMAAFGSNAGSRMVRTSPTGTVTSHIEGRGPAGYYNRASIYFPTLRAGRAATATRGSQSALIPQMGPRMDNLGIMQNRFRGGMGMGGMGGMGGGMGGGFR